MRGPSGRIARFRRRLHPGRNPIARAGDRVEAVLLMLVVAGALLAVPFAAAFGSGTYAAQTTLAEQERTTRHPATAVSLTAAGQSYGTDAIGAPADQTTVDAAWFDARGARHTGEVLADAGSPAGTRVSVWLDQHGELTSEPLSPSASAADGVFAAVLLWVAVTGALAGLYGAGRFVLSRLHSAAWDRAWAQARHDSRF